MREREFYLGIETPEGGVRTSCSLRHLEKEEGEGVREYILELLATYPDGHIFIREY